MWFYRIVLALSILFAIGLAFRWWRAKSYASALLMITFCFVYFVDLFYISFSQRVFLVASQAQLAVVGRDFNRAVLYAIGAMFVFAAVVEFSAAQRRRQPSVIPAEVSDFGLATSRTLAILIVSTTFLISTVAAFGITDALSQRQSLFTGNLPLLISYFVVGPLSVFCAFGALSSRGFMRAIFIGACLLGLVAAFLSGSRTSLFLAGVLPIVVLIYSGVAKAGKGRPSRSSSKFFAILLAASVPVLGGSLYVSRLRGSSNQPSLFGGSDVSGADVLVALISFPRSHLTLDLAGSTYGAGILSLVPRSFWPGKPLTGGAATSEVLVPEWHAITGVELAPGLLGEAWLNFGISGFVFAGVLVALVGILLDGMLRSPSRAIWLLGILLSIRGVNLVRGDLANFLTPALLVCLSWRFCMTLRRPVNVSGRNFGHASVDDIGRLCT